MNNFSFYKDGKALYCLIFIGLILSFSSSSARNSNRSFSFIFQQQQLQGVITDGNAPLPGVTISVKGRADVNSMTDYTGHYSISAGINDTLAVSFIGFKTKLIPVSGRSKIDVILQYDTTTLQEVRVNAGYYSVKESERTGSIARITSKDIENQPVTNVLATMQGRMAGVNITQTTGVPGGGFDIKIRGQNSLRSDANAPLYIIDGVPYASAPIGYNQTATTYPTTTSPLNSINPENIQSIEILKDADATAIYGSRGANGVVLITTKKGKAGKTVFTVQASTGIGNVTKFMELMNTEQYLSMRRQAYKNDNINTYPANAYDINGTWDQNRYTDWHKELIGGTALINTLTGSVSGGSQKTQFILSGNYYTESSVFAGDSRYKKGGSQFNLNHQSDNDKFRLTFSAGYNVQDNKLPAFDFTSDARTLAPNAPALYNADGSLNWANKTWNNPLRNLNAEFKSKTNDFVSNAVLTYELIPNLFIKSNFGFTNLSTTETRTSPSTIYNPANNITSARSSIYVNNTTRSSWIVEPQVNYSKEIGNGNMDVLFGATFQSQNSASLYQTGNGFASNSLIYNLSAASYITILLDDETQYHYQALFGRINYNWQQKYILNLTARRDGSSRFGPGNQFALFGAVGAAWLFSKENFLKNSSWISFGKVRSSYGTTGNDQIGDYQYSDSYTVSAVAYNGTAGLQPTRLFNKDFGWEINKKFEAALELGFLQDRIFTTASSYQNRSSNQLTGMPIAATTGFTVLQGNLDAVVENKGLELTLRTVNINSGSFNWTTSVNLTFAKNKLIRFPGLESSSYSQQYRIGEPLNIRLLYQYNGIDPQTGIYQFEDLNGDGKISFPDDQQITADLNPKYYGGLQNQFSYKQWKLDFLFQFVNQKNRAYLNGIPGQLLNQPSRMADSWTDINGQAQYQLFSTGTNSAVVNSSYYYSRSTASVEDASYIRLKNIALTYDLPLLVKDMQCRFMVQGQNLFTFTKFKDGDPEFTTSGYLPPLRIITAGIQLTF
ncbi:SusC/RagA family TonB-linked outer membrane protein [Flavobacterium sp. 140616W15]|uniref:SusC/RagA family TonB-linked outer membrane protein n=1 Tax=Flavobacterium sp. 140616W15 TaxID=2478552 RepID=UPI000F0CB8DA|nr:SusC/RagA family TonB-linked outer membrane protein [Flavobacterium sp. 140616W15]AYN03590.1 SusC/RagA family TonB-linked outer membrane protein [Flavobacterium sp. 140616W15]